MAWPEGDLPHLAQRRREVVCRTSLANSQRKSSLPGFSRLFLMAREARSAHSIVKGSPYPARLFVLTLAALRVWPANFGNRNFVSKTFRCDANGREAEH